MDKEQENRELEVKEESTQTGTEGETGKRPSGGSAFEGIYDMLPDISIRSLDRFILYVSSLWCWLLCLEC